MKKIFVVDWSLLLCFVLTAVTGVAMHIAGHGTGHFRWEVWTWLHSLAGVTFAGFAVWHVKMHIGWYKSLFKGKPGKKHVTAMLSLIALVVALTGIAMFAVVGANTGVGMWHYRLGILLSLLAVGHLVKRFAILHKSLN